MKAVLSPAMNMREYKGPRASKPLFPEKTRLIAEKLKGCDAWELEGILGVKPDRAMQSYVEYQSFSFRKRGTPAALAFDGSFTYWNFHAEDFTAEEFAFAQKHIRILSPLYGVLRPLDGIQPYRLEMGGGFSADGESLYDFWQEEIHRELFSGGDIVVNLASSEYSKAIMRGKEKGDRVITCDFLRYTGGKLKRPAVYIKMARGQMARFIVKSRINSPGGLRDFCWDDYKFIEELSYPDKFTFIRESL